MSSATVRMARFAVVRPFCGVTVFISLVLPAWLLGLLETLYPTVPMKLWQKKQPDRLLRGIQGLLRRAGRRALEDAARKRRATENLFTSWGTEKWDGG